jgi:hypothetical protein
LLAITSSWLASLCFIFATLGLSIGNFVFSFFVLEFWNSLKQHLPIFETIASRFYIVTLVKNKALPFLKT